MPAIPTLAPLYMSVLTADGIVLEGVLTYPSMNVGERYPLAVLAHQYPATRDSYAPLVHDLLAHGVATLAFDERGHGASIRKVSGESIVIDAPVGFTLEDFGAAFGSSIAKVGFGRIDDDIIRVASWGTSQNYIDASRVMLVGASVGGSAAVLAAPKVPGLVALMTFGPAGAPAFGQDAQARARAAMEGTTARALLASSEGDPFDGANNVRRWGEGLQHVTQKLVSGEAHAMAIYYDVRDDVIRFLKEVVG